MHVVEEERLCGFQAVASFPRFCYYKVWSSDNCNVISLQSEVVTIPPLPDMPLTRNAASPFALQVVRRKGGAPRAELRAERRESIGLCRSVTSTWYLTVRGHESFATATPREAHTTEAKNRNFPILPLKDKTD